METKIKEFIEKGEKLLAEIKETISNPVESSRFKKLPDGWVLDKRTNLEWAPSSQKRMNFAEAEKYAAGKGGRLPAVRELHSLVGYDRHDPAIDTAFFSDTKTDDWYWTGTTTAWTTGAAWCVLFDFGRVGSNFKVDSNYVRPVRASQCLII